MKLKSCYLSDAKIKLALAVCSGEGSNNCLKCPYWRRGCSLAMSRDALNYIIRLEWRLHEYEEKENKS